MIVHINGKNSASGLYLREIELQCMIASYAYNRLKSYADFQFDKTIKNENRPKTPVEVFADCSTFLSAVGIIVKIIFNDGGRAKKELKETVRHRSRILQDLLPKLTSIKNLAERNSFEHIDERYDVEFQKNEDAEYVWFNISSQEQDDVITLKRFNPETMEISYLESSLNMKKCYEEVQEILNIVENLHNRIRTKLVP